jgi:hypothetical protein
MPVIVAAPAPVQPILVAVAEMRWRWTSQRRKAEMAPLALVSFISTVAFASFIRYTILGG